MRRPLVLLALFAMSLFGQETGEFAIAGAVANALNGQRIGQALVQLTSSGRPSRTYRFLSDAGGTFRFSGLPAGPYALQARKPGFGPPVEPLPITIGPSREDVSLPMSRWR